MRLIATAMSGHSLTVSADGPKLLSRCRCLLVQLFAPIRREVLYKPGIWARQQRQETLVAADHVIRRRGSHKPEKCYSKGENHVMDGASKVFQYMTLVTYRTVELVPKGSDMNLVIIPVMVSPFWRKVLLSRGL